MVDPKRATRCRTREGAPSLNAVGVVALLALCAVFTGCSQHRLVGKIENGGDRPPFVELDALRGGNYSQLGAGDAVAFYDGNVTDVCYSSGVRIDLLLPYEQLGREVPAETPSKEQRKEEERRRAEEQPSKEQRKQEERGRAGQQPSKEQRKQEQKEREARLKQPFLVFNKMASVSGTNGFERYIEIKGNGHSAWPTVRLRLMLVNMGKTDFAGDVTVLDHLAEGMEFLGTERVLKVRRNKAKEVLSWLPYLSLLALAMEDWTTEETTPDAMNLSESHTQTLVRYDMRGITLKANDGVIVEFNLRIQNPSHVLEQPERRPEP